MSEPSNPNPPRRLSLVTFQRIRDWHVTEHAGHPMEHRVWEAVMTLWIMAWIGWLPAYTFEATWAYPLCLLGVLAPRLYIALRAHAHHSGRLRCDWLALLMK